MGRCLEALGVPAGDTRDSLGKPTFIPLSPLHLLNNRLPKDFWYYQYAFYDTAKSGKDCCSSEAITFHYIDPNLMRFIDWLLYNLKHDRQGTHNSISDSFFIHSDKQMIVRLFNQIIIRFHKFVCVVCVANTVFLNIVQFPLIFVRKSTRLVKVSHRQVKMNTTLDGGGDLQVVSVHTRDEQHNLCLSRWLFSSSTAYHHHLGRRLLDQVCGGEKY